MVEPDRVSWQSADEVPEVTEESFIQVCREAYQNARKSGNSFFAVFQQLDSMAEILRKDREGGMRVAASSGIGDGPILPFVAMASAGALLKSLRLGPLAATRHNHAVGKLVTVCEVSCMAYLDVQFPGHREGGTPSADAHKVG